MEEKQKKYDKAELKTVLTEHQKWLNDMATGKKADLTGANLSGANLTWADLTGANLSGADLSGATIWPGWELRKKSGSD